MSRIFANWVFLAEVWLAVAVITAGIAIVVARRRQRRGMAAPWRQTIAESVMLVGTVPWVVLMFWPRDMPTTIQPIPLVDLAAQISGDPVSASIQIVANVVVFAAVGFFGPIRFPWLRSIWRVAALGFGASALVEVLQFGLDLGRVASVDDVLQNGAGAVIAVLASRPWWRSEQKSTGTHTAAT